MCEPGALSLPTTLLWWHNLQVIYVLYLWLLLSAAFMNIIDHLGFGCIDIVTTLQHTNYLLLLHTWGQFCFGQPITFLC